MQNRKVPSHIKYDINYKEDTRMKIAIETFVGMIIFILIFASMAANAHPVSRQDFQVLGVKMIFVGVGIVIVLSRFFPNL